MESADSPNQTWTVCTCNTCSAHLEFDPANAGDTITSPKCGMETKLFVPQVPVEEPAKPEEPPPKPEPKTARIIAERTYEETGSDAQLLLQAKGCVQEPTTVYPLETTGEWFRVLGIVGAVICFLGAAVVASNGIGEPWYALPLVLVGVVALAQAFVVPVLFRAAAEIIRLLQDSKSMQFTGTITQRSVSHSYKCSLCSADAQPGESQCSHCGAEFKS